MGGLLVYGGRSRFGNGVSLGGATWQDGDGITTEMCTLLIPKARRLLVSMVSIQRSPRQTADGDGVVGTSTLRGMRTPCTVRTRHVTRHLILKHTHAKHTSAARHKFEGHSKPVEEVVFKPGSVSELASVGDDYQVIVERL